MTSVAMDELSKDLAATGIADVAVGAAELGAADVLHATAEIADEAAEEEA